MQLLPGPSPTSPTVVSGAGLAGITFRCRDAQNCWWVQAVPAYHTWNIVKIVRGRVTFLGNLGLLSSTSRTPISVHDDGDRVTVAVGDVTKRTFTDSALRGENGVGLASGRDGARAAQSTEFEADLTGPEPLGAAP